MVRKMQKTVKKQEKPSKSDFYVFPVVFTLFSRCFSESSLEISHFSDFTYPYPWIFYFPAFYRYKWKTTTKINGRTQQKKNPEELLK